jgi:hypothetical protein
MGISSGFQRLVSEMYTRFTVYTALAALFAVMAFPGTAGASFANALKKSYGGKLSSNSSTSTQQLTADPASIQKGSMSTSYDPAVSSLFELIPGPFFDVNALIGIRLSTDAPGTERFVSDAAYFAGLPYDYQETGYVQVSFFRHVDTISQSIINPRDNYLIVDTDGEIDGDDTHAFFFDIISPDLSVIPSYTLFREDGTHHAVLPDYLVNLEGTFFGPGIESATVSGAVPEPASLGLAIALAGAALLRRRRQSRPA